MFWKNLKVTGQLYVIPLIFKITSCDLSLLGHFYTSTLLCKARTVHNRSIPDRSQDNAYFFRTDSLGFTAFTVADLAPVTSPIHEKRSLRPICGDPIIQPSWVTLPAASTPGPSHPLALRYLCLFIPTWVRNVFFFLQNTGFVLPLFSPSNSLCPKLTTLPHSQEHTVYLFSMFKAAKGF